MKTPRASRLVASGSPASLAPCGVRLAGLLLGAIALGTPAAGLALTYGKPYIPASAQVVLQTVPSWTDPRVRRFDVLRERLELAPSDLALAVKLADAYIDYGRSTGDERYVGHGMAVVEPWLKEKPIPIPALLVSATVLQNRHFFEQSRIELTAILARDPRNLQAWLTLSTVAMMQADYAGANRACVQVAEIGGDFMGMLCEGQLRSLVGHARQAYALLRQIENPGPIAPPAIKGYVEGLLADAAVRLDRTAAADRHFRAALQWTPGDNFLLADYSDFLLDQHRPAAAEALLADYKSSDTSMLRIVFAENMLHDPRAPHDIAQMRARFAALDQRGSHLYEREHAEFVLYVEHDPALALRLAERNWRVQRSPKDMRILLAAAIAARQPQAAQPVLSVLAASHLQDPVVRRLTARVEGALHSHEVAAASSGSAR